MWAVGAGRVGVAGYGSPSGVISAIIGGCDDFRCYEVTMPTICLFDMDSTLIENEFSRDVIYDVLAEVIAQTEATPETLGRAMWQENERRQAEAPDDALTMDWQDIVQTVAQTYGITPSRSVDDLWRAKAHADGVRILDDAPTVLRQLQAMGCKLVIATKGLSKYQQPVLDVTGLGDFFDDILTPDITGYLKTTPAYFDDFCARQRHDYGDDLRFIQIGDHYLDDVICPIQNGFYSVLRAPIEALSPLDAFERPSYLYHYRQFIPTYPKSAPYDERPHPMRPHAVVLSLQEVPAIVQRIEAGTTL